MLHLDPTAAEPVSANVAGWAVSRGAPQPTPSALGWHVATGRPDEAERHVPVRGDAADILDLAESLPTPTTCLKFAGAYADWRPLLGREWVDNPVGWFMTTTIDRGTRQAAPYGTVRVERTGDLLLAQVRAGDELVASGRIGLAGDWCVPDRNRTAEPHRRRGFGRMVMSALVHEARAAGARRAAKSSVGAGAAFPSLGPWPQTS